MAVQVSYPGVYIDEFAPGAPIQGVGTNTAAFIGPAARGEVNRPTKVTSWEQFRRLYGEQPLPGFFLWYATRGFFENGGQVCYVVRASRGRYAGLGLPDDPTGTAALANRAGQPMLRVRTTRIGVPSPDITVDVEAAHVLASANTRLYQPTGTYTVATPRELTLTDAAQAAQFRARDWVDLGAPNTRVHIARVAGATVRLASDFVGAVGATDTIRLANAPAGTTSVRVESQVAVPRDALVPGTILTLTQSGQSDSQVVDTVETETISPTVTTYRVAFREGVRIPIDMTSATTVESEEFHFTVTQAAAFTYRNLSVEPAHPRYFARIVNEPDALVHLEAIEPAPPAAPPASLRAAVSAVALAAGAAEDLAGLTDDDYVRALDTLREVDDVNLIAIPDRPVAVVQQALIAHCEQMADRFAVLDTPSRLELFGAGSVEAHRRSTDSTRGYAGLYYPWLRVAPAREGPPILVPPSGHVCGVIARSDNARGVHKAPANEIVNGALDVERTMSDVDQGQLNLQGVNVIRVFQQGGRPVLWGARTTATDRSWQYVNIRRLFLFLEESIQEGIRWAVFEPNNLGLWEKLKRTIRAFLLQQWRDGALFGATAEEAFYVRTDETLNPDNERALGRLTIEIGVRPSYPAEFIIVRIGIWQGGSEVTEA